MSPNSPFEDTIFALSSGQPPAAIAIVRISGSQASAALAALSGNVPEARRATLATLHDPASGLVLDRALALFFPAPRTATGEDLAELHLHGGRAVVAAVEKVLARQPGLRRAEPGEFTRRAFANGVIDLAEAEGLGDLLIAETEGQRRNAMALADGTLSRTIRKWRGELIDAAAAIEARIDFADEDDVPDDEGDSGKIVARLRAEIAAMLAGPPAERLRDGIRVVIAGPPNSGKSTLFNVLVGREAAIATPIPGTTRDLIEYPVQLDGLPFIFVDSAGLRDAEDSIEQVGVARAREAIGGADIVLWMGRPDDAPKRAIRIHGRCDLSERAVAPPNTDVVVSTKTGEGLAALRKSIVSRGTSLLPREGEIALGERQRQALVDCLSALSDCASPDIIIVSEALRAARSSLDSLTGDGGVEPLLDAIFSRFCIGK